MSFGPTSPWWQSLKQQILGRSGERTPARGRAYAPRRQRTLKLLVEQVEPRTLLATDLTWAGGGVVGAAAADIHFHYVLSRTYAVTGDPVTADFTLAYYASSDDVLGNADDVLIGSESVTSPGDKAPGLHAGDSPPLTFPGIGSYRVYAVLDDGDHVPETDEADNAASAPVAVTGDGAVVMDNSDPRYSEAPTGAWYTPTVAGYDGSLRFANLGTGQNTAAWQWVAGTLPAGTYDVQATWYANAYTSTAAPYRIYQGDTLLQTVTVDQTQAPAADASAGGVAFQHLAFVTLDGSGPLRVVLGNDAPGAADHGVEADAVRIATTPGTLSNLSWAGGGVTGPASLVSPGMITLGRTYTVSGADLTGPLTIGYYASADDTLGGSDDVLLGRETVTDPAALTAGTHAGLSPAMAFYGIGSYRVYAVLDDGDHVPETDEADNAASAPVAVTGDGAVVMDNSDPRYSEAPTGAWYTPTVAGYDGSLRFANLGTGQNTAAWQWVAGTLPAGTYDVQATWYANAYTSTAAPYRIYQGDTLLQTVTVDQTQAPAADASAGGVAFQHLAFVTLDGSGPLRVVLGNDAPGAADHGVEADAVRIATVPTLDDFAPTPTIVSPAAASNTDVTGDTTQLTVVATVTGEPSDLTYLWTIESMPGGAFAPQFSDNDTATASDVTATFTSAGDYTFLVIVDNHGATATSEVTVTVEQTVSGIHLSPPLLVVHNGDHPALTAIAVDQFGHDFSVAPLFVWSLMGGLGTIDNSGHYTAPSAGAGEDLIQVSAGAITASASVLVVDPTREGGLINFEDLTPYTAVSDQYSQATFSGDPGNHIEVDPFGTVGNGSAFGNMIGSRWYSSDPSRYNHNLYVDFSHPVNDLSFDAFMYGAVIGTIGAVRVFQNGTYTATVPLYRDGASLGQFNDVTRIEILAGSFDPYGPDNLWYDNFRFLTDVVPAVQLTPHRTGDFQGQVFTDHVRLNGDPSQYMILTDNDYFLSDGTPALEADTADIPDPSVGTGDNDLARITLARLPAGATKGKIKIILSDPTAVRLFKPDGSLFYQDGVTDPGALTLDLSAPGGYLSGLVSGDLDVWMEGLHQDSNFQFTVVYTNTAGNVASSDHVNLMVADWTFRGYDDQRIDAVSPVWQEALLAAVQLDPAPGTGFRPGDFSQSFFKNQVDGISPYVTLWMNVVSEDDPTESYADYLDLTPGRAVSQHFAALYGSEDVYDATTDRELTPDERNAILDLLGLNVVHNQGQRATLKTGAAANPTDSFTRGLKVRGDLTFTLDNPNAVYQVGDHVTGTVSSPIGRKYKIDVNINTSGNPQASSGAVGSFRFDFIVSKPGFARLSAGGYDTLSLLAAAENPIGAPSLLPSGSVYIRVLAAGETLSTWQLQAWQALQVSGGVPGDELNRNRRITQLYADMFNSNPQAFEWAGMAAFASKAAGDGMAQAIDLYNLAWVGSVIGGPGPDKLLKYLGEGNLAIFLDMYPEMLAYRAGGLANITAMAADGKITLDQLKAWQAIDDGIRAGNPDKIWEGNTILAQVEQTVTLQAVLNKDLPLWASATFFKGNPWPIKSPMPGDDSTFQGFSPGTSFGNGQARFNWFVAKMVPAWQSWRKTHNNVVLDTLFNGAYK